MRIAICDHSGHAFPLQLSRELARRQHAVLHLHFAEFQSPKGALALRNGDPATLEIAPVSLGRTFAKYSLIARPFQEIQVGHRSWQRIKRFEPDVVLGCNLPLHALWQVLRGCRRSSRPFVFWQQDIYSIAITRILTKKLGPIGRLLGAYYRRVEGRAVRASAAVVVIADDFLNAIRDDFGLSGDNVHVIENWAPVEEISARSKGNAWAVKQQVAGCDVVLYTGTLGMKHDPGRILQLAHALRARPNTVVVVTSEGPSAAWLQSQARAMQLQNLRVFPFQPFELYPEVLGSADVLIAILEPDAGQFSVPSKILSYLCAERAIVLSAPPENRAFRTIRDSQGGIAVPADNQDGFIAAVRSFLDDPDARGRAAISGRRYAERTFDIGRIGDCFESILLQAKAAQGMPQHGRTSAAVRLHSCGV
jgi:colanic acid biosynthesis glycosyl transferase WcaI